MSHSLRLLSAVNTSVTAAPEEFHSAQSDYVVILAALVCALICAIGLAMVARCAFVRHQRGRYLAAPTPSPPGLIKKTLQLLPATKYVGGDIKQTDCVICLTDFGDGDLMRVLPQCGHIFHVNCIDAWLLTHSSCPSCRQLVLALAQCHNCGGFSTGRTQVHERETNISPSQDNAPSFLP